MRLWECRIGVARASAASVAEAIAEAAKPRWVVLEDRATGRVAVTGYFASRRLAAAAGRRLAAGLAPAWRCGPPRVHHLADADWRESYRAHFHRWRLGRLHWAPVWERGVFPVPPGHRVVWLDPGMAFGTGNHETTRLCCRRLVAYARQGAARGAGDRPPPAGGAGVAPPGVVDAGCGSGILAISATRLGLGPVFGFDHDPEAVRVSRENAALNGARVDFRIADLAAGLARRRAGLVLANVQADVLKRHARILTRAVAPGGCLVLSGILAGELRSTRAAFARHTAGWFVDSRTLGEWADLAFRRPRRVQKRSGGVRLRNSSR
jgi:ribosomal protein L11 methyltransferase